MKFSNTRLITVNSDFSSIKPGNWVQFDGGTRGQFMGVTNAGVIVVRYQKQGKFNKVDAKANKPLREYAKVYGAK